ncbi:hypothetical protein AVL61_15085 [Kocuria rosea subsp. polaris]|uniref:Uncharacterized protein n=1 Tax=Kocuria rosea subsp. polaris TaxID=136273 RepID=A0A0W8I6K1_KOCRO|nr:hypothetical protein [Kocuria polaris]KUG53855.1 hypothetical protein AVL61_15085 [Kocuria polaris]
MAKLTDPQQAEEAAQRLLNDRMDYVRRAITARGALDEAREALKEAEKNDVQAFQAAVNNGGWSAEELRKIGLSAPEKVQRVQRRRKATSTSPDAHTASAQDGGGTEPEQ